MAQRGIQMDREKLCCSICLDLLKDPVTIPCGHNYCMSCIKSHWDQEDQRRIHSCHQCRQDFIPRPVLMKNTMLAELVEELKKTGRQAAPADHCYAGPEDVACDVCTGIKLKAVKSCLQCLVSYCEQHLQPHYESPAFEKHKLVDASKKLQENICSRHDEVMKIFCRTDQQCICYLCSMDEHKSHDTVSAAAERADKQGDLILNQQKIQQRIQDREEVVKVLQQEVEATNRSADKAVKDCDEIFTQLIRLMEKRSSDLKQQIRSQQKTEVSRVKALQEKLTKISLTVADVDILLPPAEPRTRAEFLRYSQQITLNPNTANTRLLLSEGKRKATVTFEEQFYSPNLERFIHLFQVLSRESLTRPCYWEVEWSGRGVSVAVTYKDISRTGDESLFGNNDKSWALACFNKSYEFRHDSIRTAVSSPRSSRVGVYLDHRAGVLSFYSVSETMTLLHRVQTTFTQPLYAGLRAHYIGSTAELCELK
ncbi:E3 ubiquitin/ISG15 ligase TRIM25-like [Seriola lalandi dorsalis]|uniref:E3 ubiquitin/ISG15 ligase TRIM25-like n=1 Tax=Seriola lalandi dorsalis TaxID=1841481 RepID=UPI000C6F4579|nr:E3 ubiquitin/ISG15 ligase TRIM25-like [Seriola lalandi dorsalis]